MKTVGGLFAGAVALLALSGQAGADQAALNLNSQRYSDRNPSAATGRSGTATLSVRALLGKDGMTDVEVSSGRVDGGTAGSISKLQFKAFDSLEDVAWTLNYTGLTGATHAYRFDKMLRGQPLQTQGNIRGIDGKRTDVVTTSGNVKLRPDLAALQLQAPAQERVGLPVNIVAVVSERNGDVGATGNCVLRVDGTQVDQANGVWVDAGGTVSCAFTHVFDLAGTYQLQVEVGGVDPGDWDLANNAATATIEIIEPVTDAPFSWQAAANSSERHENGRNAGWYRYDYTSYGSDFDYVWSRDGKYQHVQMYGWSPTEVTFPVTLSFSAAADGAAIADIDAAGGPTYTYDDGWYRYEIFEQWDGTTGLGFYVYKQWYDSYFYGTQVVAQRYAGDVTYFSAGWQHYWSRYYGYDYFYTWNYSYQESLYGQFWPMDQSATMDLEMVDAATNRWAASAAISLTPYSWSSDSPWSCYSWSWWYDYGTYCSEYHGTESGRSGWASGYTGP